MSGPRSNLIATDIPYGKWIGENIYAWMSVAAILGWVLSRIPAKKEKVFLLRHGQSHHLLKKEV
jgi:hypothetical protein